jgi:hypothetical protein
MRGHGESDIEKRKSAIDAARKERDTQTPGYCFGFGEDDRFEPPAEDDGSAASILRRAFLRDAAYSTANSLFLRKSSFNAGIRSVFSGGRILIQNEK